MWWRVAESPKQGGIQLHHAGHGGENPSLKGRGVRAFSRGGGEPWKLCIQVIRRVSTNARSTIFIGFTLYDE